MRARVRAWLVALIADGVKHAHRSERVEVRVNGNVLKVLADERRRRGGASA